MTDLPIASSSPSPAPAVATRPGANPPQRDPCVEAEDSAFQTALAQELGLAAMGQAPQLPVVGAGKVKSDPALGDDAAQTAAASNAPPLPDGAGALPFVPTLPGALAPPSALSGAPPLPNAFANAPPLPNAFASTPPLSAALPGAPPLPTTLASESALSLAFAPRWTERAGLATDARKSPPAGAFTASKTEQTISVAAAAADIVESGKFAPPTEGEIRREVAFVASLLDQHKPMPAPAPALQFGSATPAAAAVTSAPAAALEARVGDRGWDQGLGDKLVWMAGQKQQVAELHLNPPDLGPLKITLTLNDDQASARFVSAHAAVRDAIETAMPRLREMLADSGITLGNASVSTDAFREQAQPQHEPRAYSARPAAATADPGAVARGERLLRSSHGLVDTFA